MGQGAPLQAAGPLRGQGLQTAERLDPEGSRGALSPACRDWRVREGHSTLVGTASEGPQAEVVLKVKESPKVDQKEVLSQVQVQGGLAWGGV